MARKEIYAGGNPLRVVTLCSGYDSQCLAINRLGIPYELVAWSEIDKYAIQAHDALFPQWADRNLGDMTKIDWAQVPDFDLLTYSTPCFEAGTLVLTEQGYKPIEEIKAGDMVLTHKNRFMPVVTPMRHAYIGNMVKIYGMGTDIIYCTEEHPFYVRRMYRAGHGSERMFHEPEWIKAKNLDKNCYLGYAINTKSELPKWDGTIDNQWGHGRKVNDLAQLLGNGSFWYLMGRYIGDGWKRESDKMHSVIICCSDRNKESLTAAAEDCGFHYNVIKERTCYRMKIHKKELCEFVGRYGYYAHGKRVDGETMSLPVDLLRRFIDGYMDSDGCMIGKHFKTTSVSRELCFGIAQCVAKVFNRPFSLYRTARPDKYVIEGRTVNQKDTYNVVWKADDDVQDKAFYEDGYVWYPLSKLPIFEMRTIEVYNMEVEGDNSYTANGAIVHNCQSISSAGLQHGFTEGSGTRSSIIWNVRDAIKVKRPRYLLLENVKAMVSKKFLPMFQLWCDEVERLGYRNYHQVLNAKDYGVPQNRERIFLVSIRDDVEQSFQFPKPQELTLTLDDVLEDEVERKYYLSHERIEGLLLSTLEEMKKKRGYKFSVKKKVTSPSASQEDAGVAERPTTL